jgi:Transglycosylase SLT domain
MFFDEPQQFMRAALSSAASSTKGALLVALLMLACGRREEQPVPTFEAVGTGMWLSAEARGVLSVLDESLMEVEPLERAKVAQAIVDECDGAQITPALVLALIQVESEFRPTATSDRGAQGLMQILPSTAQDMEKRNAETLRGEGLERHVRLGIRYLHRLERAFHGRLNWALMAYNVGPKRLEQAILRQEVDQAWRRYPKRVQTKARVFEERLHVASKLALVEASQNP